jgi:hypothetical protein
LPASRRGQGWVYIRMQYKVCYEAKNGSLKGLTSEGAVGDRPHGIIKEGGEQA